MSESQAGLPGWDWPFSFSDLTAGLRKRMDDPTLSVKEVRTMTLPFQKPAIGRVRGIEVGYRVRKGGGSLALVVKEPVGSTRLGLAGVGRREVGVYQHLAAQLPMNLPVFIAGSPHGDWLILEAIVFGRSAQRWSEKVYREALDTLIRLHDRFWLLREDLGAFPWLGRPLEGDFEVHVTAASHALERIIEQGSPASLAGSTDRISMLRRLTERAVEIVDPLRTDPSTLLHGDYWPGNIALDREGRLIVYDWQLTSIGPAILDLLTFVKKTEWWFPEAPITAAEIVDHYRRGLAALNGHRWEDESWDRLWDHALMWRFLQEWLDLLAAIPESLLAASADQLDTVWLEPVEAAAARRLQKSRT
jgi:hypothetical protein